MANRFPQDLVLTPQWGDAVRGAPSRNVAFLDFYTTADLNYFTSTVSSHTASTAVTDGSAVGSLPLNIAAEATDNGYTTWQSKMTFQWAVGSRISYGGRLQISDATESDLFFGAIGTGDTDPIGGVSTSGLYLLKADGAATADLIKNISGTPTTLKSTADTVVAATYVTWGFNAVVTGEALADITFYKNGVLVYQGENIAIPASTVNSRIGVTLQNGAAAGKTGLVDFIYWDVPRG